MNSRKTASLGYLKWLKGFDIMNKQKNELFFQLRSLDKILADLTGMIRVKKILGG